MSIDYFEQFLSEKKVSDVNNQKIIRIFKTYVKNQKLEFVLTGKLFLTFTARGCIIIIYSDRRSHENKLLHLSL